MSRKVKLIFILFTLYAITISCKEDCGCDAKTKTSVSNLEVIYDGYSFYEFNDSAWTRDYDICNEDFIPRDILSVYDSLYSLDSLNAYIFLSIYGEVRIGCRTDDYNKKPDNITITSIKLKDENK